MQQFHIVSFADDPRSRATKRLVRQAHRLAPGAVVRTYFPHDLDPTFAHQVQDRLHSGSKGFGYWIWKPQIISQTLRDTPPGTIVLYIDAGTHLNSFGARRFQDYLEICRSSKSGILAFQQQRLERNWSKISLLNFMEISPSSDIATSGQIEAGAIFLRNQPSSKALVKEWLEIMITNPQLLDDSPSPSPEHSDFQAHRHDQSIFSLIAKRHGIERLSAAETYPAGNKLFWWQMSAFPVLHKRDYGPRRKYLKRRSRLVVRGVRIMAIRLKQITAGLAKRFR